MSYNFSNWINTTIGEQCVVIAGQSPKGKYYNTNKNGLPFYQGKKEFSSRYIGSPTKWTTKTTKEAIAGDILMSVRAPVGPINFSTQKICIGRGLAAIRVGEKIDKDFLFYFLLSKQGEISGHEGAVFASINKKQIESIKLYLPFYSEQKHIVRMLDKTFLDLNQAMINTEKNLANAHELFESFLQNMFKSNIYGSQSVTLNNISDLIVDCEHKTAPTQKTGYPSIRTPNIGQSVLILDNVNRVSEEIYKQWTRRAIPQADDLILAREAPAGNIAVIPKNIKVCLGQRTVLIRPKKEKLVSKYLAFLILSKDVQKQLLSHSRGATVGHINMKDIRAFKIYNLPTLDKQLEIIAQIDIILSETKKLETIYQQKLNALNELKQSILQKAFTGELTKESNQQQVTV